MTPLYRSSVCHSDVIMAEVAGVPRPNSGAGCTVGGPKRVLHELKNAENDAELHGLDADSMVIEHTQNLWADEPYMSAPATRRQSSLKRSREFLSRKWSLHRRKRCPRRNLWPRSKFYIK